MFKPEPKPLAPEEELDEQWRLNRQQPYEPPPPPEPTFGEKLLAEVDPDRTLLDVNQRSAIKDLKNEEDLKKLCYADLSDAKNPDISKASAVFGNFLMRKIEIPNIITAWRFYAIWQTQLCIADMTEQMKDKTLTGTERVNAGRARAEAIKTLNMLIENMTRLAKYVGAMKLQRDRSKKPEFKKPKNDAPKFD